jgi:hypothetical protein
MTVEVCSPQDLLQVGALYQALGTLAAGLVSAVVALITTNRILNGTAKREKQKIQSEASEKKQMLRREKLEKIVELCCQQCTAKNLQMSDFINTCISWSHKISSDAMPNENISYLDEAEAIQVMYFPELASQIARIRKVGYELSEFRLAELNSLSLDIRAWQVNGQLTLGKRVGAALQLLTDARLDLVRVAKSIIDSLDLETK